MQRSISSRISVLALLLVLIPVASPAQLTVRIDAPVLTFSIAQQCYLPNPIPVDVTLINAADTALPVAGVRIKLIAPMALDTAEHAAAIKTPGPVAPHDSLKLRWLLVHPVVLTSSNQRVEIWVKRDAADSSMHARLIPIPGAAGAEFNLFLNALPALAPLPDSSGYQDNPFTAIARFTNTGETRADSVQVLLVLPPDCVLDPPSQPNPIVFAQPLAPLPLGDPRLDLAWTVRYTGSTRSARNDSVIVIAGGKNLAGGAVHARMARVLAIDGLGPRYAIDIAAPDAVGYDAATVYAPNPVPVAVTLRNTGRQNAVLPALAFDIAGSGASTQQPLARAPGTLAPGDSVSFSWDVALERAAAPRSVEFRATVTDIDAVNQSAAKTLSVPGQPWSLDVVDLTLPDSLQANAAETDYAQRSFTVSYRVRNSSWMATTLAAVRLNYAATDILPLAPIQHVLGLPLAAGAASPVFTDTFTVTGRSTARDVMFTVTATSTGPDTGSAQRGIHIPALRPVVRIERSGTTALAIDTARQYVPNPFEQTIRVSNIGSFLFRLDSIVLDGAVEGVTTADARTRHLAARLAPSASIEERWVFRALPADTPRTLLLTAHAYFEGALHGQAEFPVFIPGMLAALDAIPIGDEQLQYDSASLYRPAPFQRGVMLRNTGSLALRIDSASIRFDDTLVSVSGSRQRILGLQLQPGDSVSVSWQLLAAQRSATADLPFSFDVRYDDTTSLHCSGVTRIPGRPTAFTIVGMTVPALIAIASDSSYSPNPFVTSCDVLNDAWYASTLDEVLFRVEGDGIAPLTPARRLPARWLAPMEHEVQRDSFAIASSTADRTVRITYYILSARGERDSATRTVFIPGLPVTDIAAAAQPTALGMQLRPQPLPSGGELLVGLDLPAASDLRVELFTLLGSRVALLHDGALPAGHHLLRWSSAGLRPGIYFLAARSGAGAITRVVVIGR